MCVQMHDLEIVHERSKTFELFEIVRFFRFLFL